MEIQKIVNGDLITLEYKEIKKYPRYTLYDVYKNNKFMYKDTLTKLQLKKLKSNNYVSAEEVFN